MLPLYDGAPRLHFPIIIRDIVQEPDITRAIFVRPAGVLCRRRRKLGVRRSTINGPCEDIATNGLFPRRGLVPIDGNFEWKDTYGKSDDEHPYAIATENGRAFALAGNLKNPKS
ncbi:SOS response-associated peptidase family protein [Rhizobium aethiopicum]|uniref:SOS response-associated peptidase family protein n=1 Tax=Rhizobium aethiopicum TaxID=1138170 RepID=UPI000B872995